MKKFLVCLMLVLSIVTLTACQDASMKTLSKVNTTIDKVQNLVESMDTISNDILLIDNIMDEDNTGTGYDGATFTSGSYVMDSFINNILKLSNEAHNAIDLNNDTNDILLEIDANMDDIRTISKLIDSNKSKLSNDTNNSIDDICNNILMNVNRLMITRDDVTNELNSTLSLKRNYTRNVEQLTSKYTRLCSSLQTKNTYLENINNSMNNLYDTLYYIYRPSGEAESVSKSFSNIDTYENATNNYKNKQDRKYLVKKLNEQFSEYIDVINIENIEGYNFKENSEPSQRIAQDKDFQNIIKNNKEKILKGEEISGNFPRHQKSNENNWHFALGHFDIRNTEIDKKGNLHIKVYDTYDFNKENKTVANQAGYKQMHKGNLKPFFTIHDILIPKSELYKIWNEE